MISILGEDDFQDMHILQTHTCTIDSSFV